MFRGVYTLSLDAKGRLSIPARYRDVLLGQYRGQLICTLDRARCVLIYPLPDWEVLASQVEALPNFNDSARAMQRFLLGWALDVEMDAQGRVLLPPMLREEAGLEKQVVLTGQGRKFELWDEARWREQYRRWCEGELPDNAPPELSQLSI